MSLKFRRLRAIFGTATCEAFARSLSIEAPTCKPDAGWVITLRCRYCFHDTKAFRSSGMSDSFPHFYCNQCSNAIHRDSDKHAIYYIRDKDMTMELVENIASTLPDCPCGGRFVPGANPKCPVCCTEFGRRGDVVKRLPNHHVIVISGACCFNDDGVAYRVEI